MPTIDPLEAQLSELTQLFQTILGERGVSLAIYEPSGTLRRSVGSYAFRPKHASDDDRAAGVGRLTVVPVEAVEANQPFRLVVHEEKPGRRKVLDGLCRVGACSLANTLGLLSQTSQLRLLLREQSAVIDHMSDGLIVLDRFGILRYLNAPGRRILGVHGNENIGRPLKDVIDFEPFITDIFRTKRGYVDRELKITSSKINIHILDTAVPIIDDGEVVSIVNTFHEIARAHRLSNRMAGDRARYRFSDIIGTSAPLLAAIAIAERAARSSANVLLCGESGTGKEVFAQSIHNGGRRAAAPFVAVNCAALPRDLIESELFGYAPGSFTGADKSGRPGRFELATGGTIFLDEISEMPLDVQAKLLRVLQERQVTRIGGGTSISIDVQVIAAANRDLWAMVGASSFRSDLYYRLNVLRIDIPPLRVRRDDIEPLVDHSLQRTCTLMHRPMLRLGPQALAALKAYHWPGNVRELQNVIERLVSMTDDDEAESVPPTWLEPEIPGEYPAPNDETDEPLSLAEAERRAIAAAMRAHDDNITRAAHTLGITRPTLYAKLRRMALSSHHHRPLSRVAST